MSFTVDDQCVFMPDSLTEKTEIIEKTPKLLLQIAKQKQNSAARSVRSAQLMNMGAGWKRAALCGASAGCVSLPYSTGLKTNFLTIFPKCARKSTDIDPQRLH